MVSQNRVTVFFIKDDTGAMFVAIFETLSEVFIDLYLCYLLLIKTATVSFIARPIAGVGLFKKTHFPHSGLILRKLHFSKM